MGENVMLGLSDARQISDKVVVTVPAAQLVLPKLDGSREIATIVSEVGQGLTREILEQLVARLDDAGLLFGPTFDAMLARVHEEFDSSPNLPPGSTAALADNLAAQTLGEGADGSRMAEVGATKLRELMDKWIDTALKDAEDPSFDTMPAGIVAPHIDYPRGWMNYAAVWGRTRVADRPDRVVILGTNHFGFSTGVTGCDKGFASPFGLCPLDERLAGALRSRLGDALYEHRFDHEREHSIELQIPWIQHCLGAGDDGSYVKVFAALIHDPCVNEGKPYDNKGVGIDEFVGAMKDALASLPGRTLVVSSADLSHAGPAFGDPQALAGEEEPAVSARNRIISHDREMLGLFEQGKIDDLIGSMTWQQNPTRWCSIGNMTVAARILGPTGTRIINYGGAMDPEGQSLVTSCAAAMFA